MSHLAFGQGNNATINTMEMEPLLGFWIKIELRVRANPIL